MFGLEPIELFLGLLMSAAMGGVYGVMTGVFHHNDTPWKGFGIGALYGVLIGILFLWSMCVLEVL